MESRPATTPSPLTRPSQRDYEKALKFFTDGIEWRNLGELTRVFNGATRDNSDIAVLFSELASEIKLPDEQAPETSLSNDDQTKIARYIGKQWRIAISLVFNTETRTLKPWVYEYIGRDHVEHAIQAWGNDQFLVGLAITASAVQALSSTPSTLSDNGERSAVSAFSYFHINKATVQSINNVTSFFDATLNAFNIELQRCKESKELQQHAELAEQLQKELLDKLFHDSQSIKPEDKERLKAAAQVLAVINSERQNPKTLDLAKSYLARLSDATIPTNEVTAILDNQHFSVVAQVRSKLRELRPEIFFTELQYNNKNKERDAPTLKEKYENLDRAVWRFFHGYTETHQNSVESMAAVEKQISDLSTHLGTLKQKMHDYLIRLPEQDKNATREAMSKYYLDQVERAQQLLAFDKAQVELTDIQELNHRLNAAGVLFTGLGDIHSHRNKPSVQNLYQQAHQDAMQLIGIQPREEKDESKLDAGTILSEGILLKTLAKSSRLYPYVLTAKDIPVGDRAKNNLMLQELSLVFSAVGQRESDGIDSCRRDHARGLAIDGTPPQPGAMEIYSKENFKDLLEKKFGKEKTALIKKHYNQEPEYFTFCPIQDATLTQDMAVDPEALIRERGKVFIDENQEYIVKKSTPPDKRHSELYQDKNSGDIYLKITDKYRYDSSHDGALSFAADIGSVEVLFKLEKDGFHFIYLSTDSAFIRDIYLDKKISKEDALTFIGLQRLKNEPEEPSVKKEPIKEPINWKKILLYAFIGALITSVAVVTAGIGLALAAGAAASMGSYIASTFAFLGMHLVGAFSGMSASVVAAAEIAIGVIGTAIAGVVGSLLVLWGGNKYQESKAKKAIKAGDIKPEDEKPGDQSVASNPGQQYSASVSANAQSGSVPSQVFATVSRSGSISASGDYSRAESQGSVASQTARGRANSVSLSPSPSGSSSGGSRPRSKSFSESGSSTGSYDAEQKDEKRVPAAPTHNTQGITNMLAQRDNSAHSPERHPSTPPSPAEMVNSDHSSQRSVTPPSPSSPVPMVAGRSGSPPREGVTTGMGSPGGSPALPSNTLAKDKLLPQAGDTPAEDEQQHTLRR